MMTTPINRSPEPGARLTVIYVDDSPQTRKQIDRYVRDKLAASGVPHVIHFAESGLGGRQLIAGLKTIDFAVIDFNLGDDAINGTKLCREILEDKSPKATVLLFSAADPKEIEAEELPKEVKVVLEKDHKKVKEALDECIGDFKRALLVRKNSSEGDKG